MYITNLKIKNIACFVGEHNINIEDIFSKTDIFAITGKTGSGKSSILDCISLALYGRSYKTILKSFDFVSLNMREGTVELSFEVKGDRYLAIWNCVVLKKDGSIKKQISPKRTLYKNSKLSNERIESIINLDYEQFNKTIILNQGQFAKLLTSNYAERKKILEKLYGNQEISIISRFLRNKLKEISEQITHLDQINHELLDNSSNTHIKEDLTVQSDNANNLLLKYENDQKEISTVLNIQKKLKKELQNINTAIHSIIDLLSERKKNTKRIIEFYDQINNLTNDEINFQTQIPKAQEKLTLIENEFNHKLPQLLKSKSLNISLDKINISFQENTTFKLNKNKFIEAQKNKLKHQKNDLNQISLQHENLSKKITDYSLTEEKINYNLNLVKELENNQIQQFSIVKNIKSTKLELIQLQNEKASEVSSKNESRDQITIIEKRYKIERANISKLKQIKVNTSNYLHSIEDLKVIDDQLSSSKDETLNSNEKIKLLIIELGLLKNELSKQNLDYGKYLCIKNAPKKNICPICNQNYKHDNLMITTQTKDLESITKKIDLIEIDIVKQKSTIEINQRRCENLLKDKKEINKGKENFSLDINDQRSTIDNDLIIFINQSKEFEWLEKSISKKNEHIKNLEVKISTFENENINYSKIKDHFYTDNNITDSKSLDELSTFYKSILNEINKKKNLDQQLSFIKENITNLEFNIVQLQQDISLFDEKELILKKEQKEILEELDTFEKITNPDIQIKNFKKEIDKLKGELLNLNQLNNDLLREKNSKISLLSHCKQQVKDIDLTIIINQNKVTQSLSLMLEKSYSFITSDQYKKLLSFLEKLKSDKDFDILQTKLEQMTVFNEITLDPIINLQDQYCDQLRNDYTRTNTLKNELEKKIKKINKNNQQVKLLQKDLSEYSSINMLIGNDRFRNFVLDFLQEELIKRTNKELEDLCDSRYKLTQIKNNISTDFYIEDFWNEGKKRKISTLSGGETFLVSLAMALSLADLFKGKANINCFFIDEGFGHLDIEHIDQAFEILTKISNSNKKIGIITHVKELSDRFNIKLKVTKSMNGSSISTQM